MNIEKRDEFFMRTAYLVASQSKDPSTKIGAVVIEPESCQILATGYNGICRGLNDDIEERFVAPKKYMYFEHAERNAIYSAARQGIALKGGIMFTQAIPCCDCGRAVIQAGIKQIIIHKEWTDIWNNLEANQWPESQVVTEKMFDEIGIIIIAYSKKLGIKTLIKGKEYLI